MFEPLIYASLIIQQIVEQVKRIINDGKPNWYALAASLLGVAVAIFGQLDIFQASGIDFIIPYFGEALTGLTFGAGSGIVFDLIEAIKKNGARE
jgi:hypothetical protein